MQWDQIPGVNVTEDPAELSERTLVPLVSKSAHAEQWLVHFGSLESNALHGVGVLRHHKASPFSHVEQSFSVRHLA